jgi:hypothetical protein
MDTWFEERTVPVGTAGPFTVKLKVTEEYARHEVQRTEGVSPHASTATIVCWSATGECAPEIALLLAEILKAAAALAQRLTFRREPT